MSFIFIYLLLSPSIYPILFIEMLWSTGVSEVSGVQTIVLLPEENMVQNYCLCTTVTPETP
jgi:hypothetical protein